MTSATRQDLRRAMRFSWLALAAIGGALVLLPYVLAPSAIQEWVGICPARAAGQPCSLCGMTTAFYLIAGGQFNEATLANYASVPLYSGLAVNAIAGVLDVARRWRGSPSNES